MKIYGLDLSLTATGIASVTAGSIVCSTVKDGNRTGVARLHHLLETVTEALVGADLVVLEGPAFHAVGGHQHDRAGLWWLVYHRLWRTDIPVVVVNCKHLKQFASGNGNASKEQVLIDTLRRFPTAAIGNNNEADALVLASMAADHYGWPLAKVTAVQRKVLSKVEWPVMS